MAIKPVEAQVNISRTTEVSKTNADEKNKEAAFQQGQSDKTQKDSEVKLKKVLDKEKAERLKVKEKKESSKDGKNKKKKKDDTKKEHVIDIEV